MVQSLKQIKRRIKSVENTRKITRAMEMVSVAKLKQIQTVFERSRLYFQKLDGLLGQALAASPDFRHPFLTKKSVKKHICLCVVASDTGLCGMYNHSIIRLAHSFIKDCSCKLSVVAVGRRSVAFFKKYGIPVTASYIGLNGKYNAVVAQKLADTLMNMVVCDGVDEVYIAYEHFTSLARYKPGIDKILNIERQPDKEKDFIFEPSADVVLENLLPHYISSKIKLIILESFVVEHASRMIAMRGATDNAKEIGEALVLMRNKARQAMITKEIIEIISSAETLKEA